MRRARLARLTAAGLTLALLAACGLKPSAEEALRATGGTDAGTGPGGVDGGTGAGATDGTGSGGNGTGGTGTGSGGTGSGGTRGTGSTGGTGGTGTGTGANAGGGSDEGGTSTGDSTGITATTITVGLHVPITNAAPVPQTSFTRGANLYFQDRPLNGRQVRVAVQDDQYRPSVARQRCEKLAADSFVVVGGAGTDQIQACATDQVLRSRHVPYLSVGVTENGLRGLPDYFALSASYAAQARLVMKNALAHQADFPTGQKWALVVAGTANFDDALAAMKGELGARGIAYDERRTSKDENNADAQSTALFLNAGRYPVVYFLSSPTYFTQVVGGVNYDPTYTGVGVSMGLNAVANLACGKNRNYRGYFLSPSPGLDLASRNAEFTGRAGSSYDDIMWLLYGIGEVIYQALAAVRGPLTRQSFVATLERSALPGGGFPPVAYQPGDHFGGSKAWMLKSDCSYAPPGGARAGAYRTVGNAPLAP